MHRDDDFAAARTLYFASSSGESTHDALTPANL
jgi:hypothetical protein